MKTSLMAIVLCGAMGALAGTHDPWSLTFGPAWRARVKSSISGSASVPGISKTSSTVTRDGEIVIVQDPDYPDSPDMTKYAATKMTTETIASPNSTSATLANDDIDRPLGLKANLGYDFYRGEHLSVGLNLKFAGYWNMRSGASGRAGGGTVRSRSSTAYYLYNDGPFPDDTDFSGFEPSAEPYAPYSESSGDSVVNYPASIVHAKIRSDLYQLGLGPRATWHAFDRLDIYVGADVLCNIAHMDVDAGARDASDTDCMLGFGGLIGASGYFTDNIGICAEVGYEWIDDAESDLGGVRAKVDYSSLVVSTGLIVNF